MLDRKKKLELTELMQDQFTDIAILREKPFVFDNSNGSDVILVVKPVLFKEHDTFLKNMAQIVIDNYEMFSTLDFLNSYDYKDPDAVSKLVSKVTVFTADKRYTKFKREAIKFILRWAFVCKKRKYVELKHNKKLCKKFLEHTEPSEFIHILFLLFVMNFDVVKKNLVEFLKMFRNDLVIESNIQTDTSMPGISEKAVVLPKYSPEPFSKSTLDLLEQQSKM